MVCENFFTAPPRPKGCKWCFESKIDYIEFFYEILNLEGHKNRITGSRITAILLNWWIFLLDKVVKLVGEGCVMNGAYPV